MDNGQPIGIDRPPSAGALDSVAMEVLEVVPDAMLVTDASGQILWANGRAARLFGFGRDEMAGQPVEMLVPKPARAAHAVARDAYGQHPRQRGVGGGRELRGLRKDGSEIPVDIALSPLQVRGRALVVVTVRDVSERARLVEELRRSEARYRHLVENAPDGLWEIDTQMRFVHISAEMARQLGYAPAELIGAGLGKVITPQSMATISASIADRQLLEVAGEATDIRVFDLECIRRDGSTFRAEVHSRPLRGKDDAIIGFLGATRDVTVRKHFEAGLKEAATRLREYREHLNSAQRVGRIGSSAIDIETGKSQWSDELFCILGLDPETTQPGGDAVFALVHPDDVEGLKARRERWTSGQEAEPAEVRIRRPSGEERWLYVQSEFVVNDEGNPSKVITTFHDITERKRIEAERAELERQLMQSQKLEAVGQLTGGVAHDFNNLLSVISGRLTMLWEELADRPGLREWVHICLKAADRGASLTRSMLAFSRQQPLAAVRIDVARVIADLMELLPRTLGETVEIHADCAPGLWWCEADQGQLQNAVLNLALNARDAMPNGGRLTIEARNVSLGGRYALQHHGVPSGDYVAVSVSDTGVGMTADVAAKAFDPFFTTKDVGKGSGLGLSMVYGFIKQSGGHVNIASEPGHGTTVRLFLPRREAPAVVPEPERRERPAQRGSETVLVVEDAEDMRDLTVTMLRKLGYQVVAASNAPHALTLLKEHPQVSLLLTDMTLPGGVSGRGLAERALAERPSLKVLYMSGYTREAVGGRGIPTPGARFLEKPFNALDLAKEVRAAIDRG